MIFKFAVSCFAAALGLVSAAGTEVWTASHMVRVTPSSRFPDDAGREISLSLARRERESAQILVTCGADAGLSAVVLEIEPLCGKDGRSFSGAVKC